MARSLNPVKLDPITKVVLEGVYDEKCILHRIYGLWHILKKILQHVKRYWKDSVVETRSIRKKTRFIEGDMISYLNLHNPVDYESFPFARGCSLLFRPIRLMFPKHTGININMMPFILHEEFEKCRLPKHLFAYWRQIISNCIFDDDDNIGKVCYLTIHESKVKKRCTQRRPGIHTERPGSLHLRGEVITDVDKGQGNSLIQHNKTYHCWGMGISSYNKDSFKIRGGIFMASNVADSCRVWDCQIMDDTCIGHLGDIEHLTSLLPESEVMEPNCLYWITDRTPHESLPLKKKTYRQFFRLVTSQVSLWFEDHSTKNPLGVVPDPNITKIVKGSKFNKGEAYIVSGHPE